jgi:hypothetical protein
MVELPHDEEGGEHDSCDELSMTTMGCVDTSEVLDQEDWQEPDNWCESEEPYEDYTLDEGYITLLLEEGEEGEGEGDS